MGYILFLGGMQFQVANVEGGVSGLWQWYVNGKKRMVIVYEDKLSMYNVFVMLNIISGFLQLCLDYRQQ